MPVLSFIFPQVGPWPALSVPKICSFRPVSARMWAKGAAFHGVPARDRVIEFGKHRGKMLGALPSSYLRWVSQNLRARDFEEWALLADEVLGDPVYRDRIEWEAAERVLAGGAAARRWSDAPAADLADVSERFGWDNDDREGWARVNFELLGTSKGGRIPRIQQMSGGEKGGVLRTKEDEGHREGRDLRRGSGAPARIPAALSDRRVGRWNESSGMGRKVRPLSSESGGNGRKVGSLSTNGRKVASLSNIERKEGSWSSQSIENAVKVASLSRGGIRNGRKVASLSKERKLASWSRESIENGIKVGSLSKESIGNGIKVVMRSREERRARREEELEMVREGQEQVFEERKSEELFVNPFPGRRALLNKIKRKGTTQL